MLFFHVVHLGMSFDRLISDQKSYWTKTNKVKYAYLAVPVVPRRFRTEVPAADLIGPDFSVFLYPGVIGWRFL